MRSFPKTLNFNSLDFFAAGNDVDAPPYLLGSIARRFVPSLDPLGTLL